MKGQILPVEEGLDGLAKEILGGGRTYSVFDLAKLVMGARERFNVGFKSDGSVKFYRSKKDGSVWLSKAEALRHFARADWRKDFYREVTDAAEPPKGNFQAIAVCGISGELLGPPNYHDYQASIARIHAERFSNMPIDRYKAKIRMEKGEEAVNAWLEKMSRRVRYLPVTESSAAPEKEEAAKVENATEEAAEADAPATPEAESESSEEVESGEPSGEEAPAAEEAPSEEAPAEETPAEDPPAPAYSESDLLDDLRAVEQHFSGNHFKDVYVECDRCWVAGNIPGNSLSPGLLTLLRETVGEERRYPSKLTPMLCRQLSGRHVAVFKWKKKLKAGPSRPHEVPSNIQLAERPRQLLTWVQENSGGTLEALWSAVLPEGVTDEAKHEWYHDLHWLLNQGYILLLSDSSLHMSKAPGSGQQSGPRPAAAKKAPRQEPSAKETVKESPPEPGEEPTKDVAPAPAPPVEPAPEAAGDESPEGPTAQAKTQGGPGLYRLQGRRLSGQAIAEQELAGSGLWPTAAKWLSEEEGPEDEQET